MSSIKMPGGSPGEGVGPGVGATVGGCVTDVPPPNADQKKVDIVCFITHKIGIFQTIIEQ